MILHLFFERLASFAMEDDILGHLRVDVDAVAVVPGLTAVATDPGYLSIRSFAAIRS